MKKTYTPEGCFFTPNSLVAIEQMGAAQLNLATGRGPWNTIKNICTAEGCFFVSDTLVDLEQVKLAASKGMMKTCSVEGCFFTPNPSVDSLVAGAPDSFEL
nr:unnamed protein product [Callosobruchus analis]